ncbi:MAG: hypothetical protein GX410_02675 [Elusimicrobia bacterium]|nr:hypothetical protein [Elusimicrobiota bacterium]
MEPEIKNESEQDRPGRLDAILSCLNAPVQETSGELKPEEPAPVREEDDRKSLKKLRENLMSYDWARQDVYRISLKFFKERTAQELDAQFQKLLASFHYLESPAENHDLALKVLLNEMTSTEAMKKSLLRRDSADLRKVLSQQDWSKGYVEQLVGKYAGEKTIAEINAKFHLVINELPYESDPRENTNLALKVMLDWANYEQIKLDAQRNKYVRETARVFKGLSQEYVDRIVEKFFNRETVHGVFDRVLRLTQRLRVGVHPRDHVLAVRTILGDITEDEARLEVRKAKNAEDISRVERELALGGDTVSRLMERFAKLPDSPWFDEEFPAIFGQLQAINDAPKDNAMLAVRALAGELNRENALGSARRCRNLKDIQRLAKQLELKEEYLKALLKRYDSDTAGDFYEGDYLRILNALRRYEGSDEANAMIAVRVLVGEIPEDSVIKMSELVQAFARYELPEEALDRLSRKFLSTKTPAELLAEFEAVLDKMPYVDSREENCGAAVEALLNEKPEALAAMIDRAKLTREKGAMLRALNGYGWFSGFATELQEKYYGKKTADQLIDSFENSLAEMDYLEKPTENYDLGIKILLEKISLKEARREAQLRKGLKSLAATTEFVRDITERYLGAKTPEEVTEFFQSRLKNYTFWQADNAQHRYIIDVLVDELNGKSSPNISVLCAELLDSKVPLSNVRTILSFFMKKEDAGFDPTEACKIYMGFYQAEGDHDKATGQMLKSLS